eukprot:520562-Alexandrium_andersonii.AAC.1
MFGDGGWVGGTLADRDGQSWTSGRGDRPHERARQRCLQCCPVDCRPHVVGPMSEPPRTYDVMVG